MSTEPMKLTACGTEFVNALDGKGWTVNGVWVGFEMNYVLSELHATRAEIASLTAMRDNRVKALALADAEIAKLKSDLTKAHQDGYAEGRKHRVAAVETHADEMYRAQEEIAKLRVDLDQARRDRNSAVECAEVLRGYVAAHKADLAAARAALDGEREALAYANQLVVFLRSLLAIDNVRGQLRGSELKALTEALDRTDRRAAEAKAVPPNRTGTREESQAISDWHHDEIARRAAEAKRPMSEIACKAESTPGTTAEPGSALRGLRFPEGPTLAEMNRLIDEESQHVPDGSITYLRGGPLKKGSLWCNARTGETKEWNGSRWVDGPPTKITVQPDGTKVVTVIGDAPGGCTVEGRIEPPKEGA